MTESEKRREELLRRARTIYSDKKIPPAVHPRYQSFYTKLYDTQEEHEMTGSHSTFGVRMFIAILLFALFVAMDYKAASCPQIRKNIYQTMSPHRLQPLNPVH